MTVLNSDNMNDHVSVCDICTKEFKTEPALKAHKTKFHKKNPKQPEVNLNIVIKHQVN